MTVLQTRLLLPAAVLVGSTMTALWAETPRSGPANGRLYESALLGAVQFDIDEAATQLGREDANRLRRYADRRASFRSLLGAAPAEGGDWARWVHLRRVSLEREMVALIERPDIAAEAAAAARAARPVPPSRGSDPAAYEYEISWADAWMQHHPSSPVRPFLQAYTALWIRAAIERNSELPMRLRLAQRYARIVDGLRAQPDRIWTLLADDLDAEARVTNDGPAHPREFLRSAKAAARD